MTRAELEQAILEAGNKFDGHVTNGSHAEIMKVIDAAFPPKPDIDEQEVFLRGRD